MNGLLTALFISSYSSNFAIFSIIFLVDLFLDCIILVYRTNIKASVKSSCKLLFYWFASFCYASNILFGVTLTKAQMETIRSMLLIYADLILCSN